MVDGERHLAADDRPDVRNVLLQHVESFFRDVNAGKRVRNVVDIVVAVLDFAKLLLGEVACVPGIAALRDFPHLFQET
ncbi:hypothetical protein D3C76_1603290 [compost metagenome]